MFNHVIIAHTVSPPSRYAFPISAATVAQLHWPPCFRTLPSQRPNFSGETQRRKPPGLQRYARRPAQYAPTSAAHQKGLPRGWTLDKAKRPSAWKIAFFRHGVCRTLSFGRLPLARFKRPNVRYAQRAASRRINAATKTSLRNRIHVFCADISACQKTLHHPAPVIYAPPSKAAKMTTLMILFRCVDIPARFSRLRNHPLTSGAGSEFRL